MSHEVTQDRVDLSPFSLLIACPAMDGTVDLTFQHSLEYTKRTIEEYGGKCCVHFTKYVADIAYARSKLFGSFIRDKQFTHILYIDSDQGWNPVDVAYMLLLQRDFLAAVSPKKTYPLEFAFNMAGDDGKIGLLYHELDTNVAEMPFVGGAFVMLSRNCCEKLAASYPELEYFSPDNDIEYGIFDPVIIGNRRRLSEDYALCYRWRKIGGKVEVKMDVVLEHTGNHTFRGSLLEHFTRTQPGFGAPLGNAKANGVTHVQA